MSGEAQDESHAPLWVLAARGGTVAGNGELVRCHRNSTTQHAAINLIKEIPDKASIKVRRKIVAWDGLAISFKRLPWVNVVAKNPKPEFVE